jgi:hypothetical protein
MAAASQPNVLAASSDSTPCPTPMQKREQQQQDVGSNPAMHLQRRQQCGMARAIRAVSAGVERHPAVGAWHASQGCELKTASPPHRAIGQRKKTTERKLGNLASVPGVEQTQSGAAAAASSASQPAGFITGRICERGLAGYQHQRGILDGPLMIVDPATEPFHGRRKVGRFYSAACRTLGSNRAKEKRPVAVRPREYYRRLFAIYGQLIPRGLRVLEVGSGSGDLLASLQPSAGIGVDFSPDMVGWASERHPDLQFVVADAHRLERIEGPFDAIVLSDLLNDIWDVQGVLGEMQRLCSSRTRLVLNVYSHLWEAPLRVRPRACKLARPKLRQNWLTL